MFYTVEQIQKFLDSSLPTGVDIFELLNQVGDRIYALGRWPETTDEVVVTAGDIFKNAVSGGEYEGDFFCYIDADLYDGVIGFRVNKRPYGVKPKGVLYSEAGTYGSNSFIDFGVEENSSGDDRMFRLPNGVGTGDNIQALVKKQWTEINDIDQKVKIRPLGAIKHGMLAISHENHGEPNLAAHHWQECEKMLFRDDKQYSGVKNVRIRYKNLLKRKNRPTSFT